MYHIDPQSSDIVIDGFENGIGTNPYTGISDMRNINLNSVPGEASVNFSTTSITLGSVSGSVASADAPTDVITFSGLTGTLANGQALTFTGASLPAGISAGTIYWLGNVSGLTGKIYTKPNLTGLVDITGTGTGTFASTDMGKPQYRTYDKDNNNYYIIDANGRVWGTGAISQNFVFMGNTTLTNANGNGIVYYRGYLFAFRNNTIDYMVPSTFAWTYGWQTLNTAAGTNNSHYAIAAYADITVYYCDGSYLGSFFQVAGQVFNPATPATYTFNQQALILPSFDTAICLAELGTNLLTGGTLNAIYPWDRLSVGYSYPILLGENYISRMVTVNTTTYVFAGNRGRIYRTNGSQASLFVKVPDHLSNTVEPYFQWGDANFLKNQLYFGVSAKNNAGTAITAYGGLWAIDLETGAIRLSNQLSYGTYAGLASVVLPIYVAPSSTTVGIGMYIGWDSGASTYGMDGTISAPYSGGQSYVISDMIPIGTLLQPTTSQQVEFKLAAPLLTNESVELQVASYWNGSFTSAGITTGSGSATILSGNFPMPIQQQQWILLKVILTGKASSPSYNRITQLRIIQKSLSYATQATNSIYI